MVVVVGYGLAHTRSCFCFILCDRERSTKICNCMISSFLRTAAVDAATAVRWDDVQLSVPGPDETLGREEKQAVCPSRATFHQHYCFLELTPPPPSSATEWTSPPTLSSILLTLSRFAVVIHAEKTPRWSDLCARTSDRPQYANAVAPFVWIMWPFSNR